MAGHPLGQLFSKLHEAFAAPGGTTHRLVIDRRTIEKTWKYMDKVFVKSKVKHNILQFKAGYINCANFSNNSLFHISGC